MSRALTRSMAALVVIAGSMGAIACGQGSGPGSPAVGAVPLAAGSHVLARVRRCDGGVHAYCGQELVIGAVAGRYPSSASLQRAEMQRLTRAGWATSEGDTTHELAAESPGQKLHLTYATDQADLESIDLGRIDRSSRIARALSHRMFARAPALSLMLQPGSS